MHGLLTRLTSGPGGVIVLCGTRGVGKSKLVDAVLNELAMMATAPQVHRHDVNAIVHLDVRTFRRLGDR
ncbi:hypothetical protein [Actinophytocola sp.]|uniref:hypothetical protein n=1 Tax=Actinophytocola sp. TaxID=1872138 RepID=UPI00389A32A3